MNDYAFDGKVAIVTGATRGIGRAVALKLAQSRAKVAFNYLQSDDAALDLIEEIEAAGSVAYSCKGDIRNFEHDRQFVKEVRQEFGTIDFLVNNAGITRDKTVMMMQPEDWHEVIDTNLTGYFNMCWSVMLTMLKQKSGCIVNLSSISGISGIPGQVNYAASKAGIIGLTKSLAKEVASYNIRVNCVAPGFIDTDMTKSLKESMRERLLETIPMTRFGSPDDVAKVVLFLLSDRSNYITGQILKVDGGLHMSF